MARRKVYSVFLALFALLLLISSGCTGGSGGEDSSRPEVIASSFVLANIVKEVGGTKVRVEDLSKYSGHAHNLELSPIQASRMSNSDLVLYLSEEFQPAVERALDQMNVESIDAFDFIPEDEVIQGDSHIWLDPVSMIDVAEGVSEKLSKINPEWSDYYEANTAEFVNELRDVDREYSKTLSRCESRVLLTTHEAFGYMAKRYGLDQIGVTGVDPEAEPSPARIRELQKIVEEEEIKTLFYEKLSSDHQVKELSKTLGVTPLPLDTMEVEVENSAKPLKIYRSNLNSLREGLDCE